MSKRLMSVIAVGLVGSLALAACSSGDGTGTAAPAPTVTDPANVSGDITVLTNRTDLVQDGSFVKYTAAFNKVYPKVKVTIQGVTDYDGEVKTRMNTKDYGDVLLIPGSVQKADYVNFFAPLGTQADLSKKYNWTNFTTVNGNTYGLAQNGNANGAIYNKKVWDAAGITALPKTPQEFLTDLKAIKAKGQAIPYYTNYHDGWPVGQWQGALGSATCDPNAHDALATQKAPWSPGKELYTIDSVLFDAVNQKLTEPDPTTTNWEGSKAMLATGKIGFMWLGSWAVKQFKEAATKAGADPATIGFMPFPAQVGGKFCSVTGPDLNQAINKHSTHQEAARAWLDWFTDKSGYAQKEGGLPTLKSGTPPDTLNDFTTLGVKYIELTQDQAAMVDKIDNAAEIGLAKPDYRQKIVDVARGAAAGDLNSTFADLNKKWAQGISTAGL